VNCIAINGMNNRVATMSTMPISLLFCVIINVLFYNWFVYKGFWIIDPSSIFLKNFDRIKLLFSVCIFAASFKKVSSCC
jgi:hypothetical protein